ncbi:MAG: glycine cleavage system protein H [Moraxellaceae bacterium]|nr:glycine cleavage system protein H [Pseudobdellovibrionaceae bacterium]
MHYLWYSEQDGVITIGINEEGLEDITEINSIDLPQEQDEIDADSPIGTLDSDDGQLDIFSPVKGTVIEVNSQVLENPEIILEDSYEEGWLLRIETTEELEDEDLVDDDDDDDDDDEKDFEDEEESDKD